MSFEDKKYTINGKPASAYEIIREAQKLSGEKDNPFYQTSIAIKILEDSGYEIGNHKKLLDPLLLLIYAIMSIILSYGIISLIFV